MVNVWVNLKRNTFSSDLLEKIKRQISVEDYTGPRIIYPTKEISSQTFEELLEELVSVTGDVEFSQAALQEKLKWNPAFKAQLSFWLGHWFLCLSPSSSSWGESFKKEQERKVKGLQDIVKYLKRATEDSHFFNVFKVILGQEEITGTCFIISSTIDLEMQYQLATFDKRDLVGLSRLLTRGILALALLTKLAREKGGKSLSTGGIYLGYLIQLREKLQLPIDAEDKFSFYAPRRLTERDLCWAVMQVETVLGNEERIHEFLLKQEIWLEALREQDPLGPGTREMEWSKRVLLEKNFHELHG